MSDRSGSGQQLPPKTFVWRLFSNVLVSSLYNRRFNLKVNDFYGLIHFSDYRSSSSLCHREMTNFAHLNLNTMSTNQPAFLQHNDLLKFVQEMAAVCTPKDIRWCNGSKAEYDELCQLFLDGIELMIFVKSDNERHF